VAEYFADTAFWIAPTNKRDQHHANALLWQQWITRKRSPTVTTEAVLWEWLNGLSGFSTRSIAVEGYGRVISDHMIEVVPFSNDLIATAVRLYDRRSDKHWSLTDCSSFLVMQERGIREALTTDHHFEQAGFVIHMLDNPPHL
jgi:uncharacterized protein